MILKSFFRIFTEMIDPKLEQTILSEVRTDVVLFPDDSDNTEMTESDEDLDLKEYEDVMHLYGYF